MKRPALRLLALSSLCALLASAAHAVDTPSTTATMTPGQPGHGHGRGGPGMGGHGMGGPNNPDSDANGKVSLEEFVAAAVLQANNMFTLQDKNNDGLLTQDEVQPLHRLDAATTAPPVRPQGPPPGRGGQGKPPVCAAASTAPATRPDDNRFASADTNADGKLSLTEVTAAATTHAKEDFSRLDSDGDGFLTSADRPTPGSERAKGDKLPPVCNAG